MTVSPDLTAVAGSRIVRPAIFTWPARIKAFRWERESLAMCAASTRSSRAPRLVVGNRDCLGEHCLSWLKTCLTTKSRSIRRRPASSRGYVDS